MKLFRHYKNKPYKYIGLARHSETLEEMVIYQCLYDNPQGLLWVRPKEMFFENVTINNAPRPRFQSIPLQIKNWTEPTDEQLQIVETIMQKTLESMGKAALASRLKAHPNPYLSIAYADDQPVGFKLGYQESTMCFYSWLGAVLPSYQGLGIASALMKEQHQWCQKKNYVKIKTKTQNQYQSMLMLNLKFGFKITGTETSDRGLKIVMEKDLSIPSTPQNHGT